MMVMKLEVFSLTFQKHSIKSGMMIESEKWCAFRASMDGLVVYLLGWRVWRAWVGSVLTWVAWVGY